MDANPRSNRLHTCRHICRFLYTGPFGGVPFSNPEKSFTLVHVWLPGTSQTHALAESLMRNSDTLGEERQHFDTRGMRDPGIAPGNRSESRAAPSPVEVIAHIYVPYHHTRCVKTRRGNKNAASARDARWVGSFLRSSVGVTVILV